MLDLWDEVRQSEITAGPRAFGTKTYRLPPDVLEGLQVQKTEDGASGIPLDLAKKIKQMTGSLLEVESDEIDGYVVHAKFRVFGGYAFTIRSDSRNPATHLEVMGAHNPSPPVTSRLLQEPESAPVPVVAEFLKVLRDSIAEGRPRAGPAAAGASGGKRTRRKSKKTSHKGKW